MFLNLKYLKLKELNIMIKTNSFFKKIMAIILAMTALVTTFTFGTATAQAATSGTTGSRTITVNTKSVYYYPGSSSITLKQDKCTLTWKSLFGKKTKETSGYYGCYIITICNVTDNETVTKKWNGKKSITLSLKGNKTYKITVSYDSYNSYYKLMGAQPKGYGNYSGYSPRWSVSGSWKVADYS